MGQVEGEMEKFFEHWWFNFIGAVILFAIFATGWIIYHEGRAKGFREGYKATTEQYYNRPRSNIFLYE